MKKFNCKARGKIGCYTYVWYPKLNMLEVTIPLEGRGVDRVRFWVDNFYDFISVRYFEGIYQYRKSWGKFGAAMHCFANWARLDLFK